MFDVHFHDSEMQNFTIKSVFMIFDTKILHFVNWLGNHENLPFLLLIDWHQNSENLLGNLKILQYYENWLENSWKWTKVWKFKIAG